jgi:hypothetical protein
MNNMPTQLVRFGLVILVVTLLAGCSKSPLDLVPVTGTLTYEDGTVPVGELRVVRFEPVGGFQSRTGPRAATAELKDDGSFTAMTLRPDDGVVPGEYKIALVFFKSRGSMEPILPDEYRQSDKTPLAPVTVKADGKNHFELVVKKRTKR